MNRLKGIPRSADTYLAIGKRILELQTSLALLSTGKSINKDIPLDPYARFRRPFQHPSLDGAEALLGGAASYFLHHKAISALAVGYGIPEIVRWWPKMVRWRVSIKDELKLTV
jgi:large subunit ribosomal protein L15